MPIPSFARWASNEPAELVLGLPAERAIECVLGIAAASRDHLGILLDASRRSCYPAGRPRTCCCGDAFRPQRGAELFGPGIPARPTIAEFPALSLDHQGASHYAKRHLVDSARRQEGAGRLIARPPLYFAAGTPIYRFV